ncbi:MAG: hypothetical protein DRJ69_01190 [Thermoprotei archaeon]|nr:MAG: hypothetical protein DRJ69_01190 [Thermoprotei archaeon]
MEGLEELLECSMKCMAQAAVALADSLDQLAQNVRSKAVALYARYASYDLRKYNMLLRSAIEALGSSLNEPVEGCVKAAGQSTVDLLNEALRILSSGSPDLAKLIEVGRALAERAMVHTLAYAKAFAMLSPGHEHLAIALEAAAKSLQGHVEALNKLKPMIVS